MPKPGPSRRLLLYAQEGGKWFKIALLVLFAVGAGAGLLVQPGPDSRFSLLVGPAMALVGAWWLGKLIVKQFTAGQGARGGLGAGLVKQAVIAAAIPGLLLGIGAWTAARSVFFGVLQSPVEGALNRALSLNAGYVDRVSVRLVALGKRVAGRIAEMESASGAALPQAEIDRLFGELGWMQGLSLIGRLDRGLSEAGMRMTADFAPLWAGIKLKADFEGILDSGVPWTTLATQSGMDYAVSVLPIPGRTGFIVLAEPVGEGLLSTFDVMAKGAAAFHNIEKMTGRFIWIAPIAAGAGAVLALLYTVQGAVREAKRRDDEEAELLDVLDRLAQGEPGVRPTETGFGVYAPLKNAVHNLGASLDAERGDKGAKLAETAVRCRALLQKSRHAETILDNIGAGVATLDEEGRVAGVNKAASRILGIDGRRFIGRAPREFMRAPYVEIFEHAFAAIQANPEVGWRREVDVRLGRNEMKLLVTVAPVPTDEPGKPGLAAVFEDVTEIEKMQRLAAWREVAKRMAHEIKNPLTPIKLSAQRLMRKYGERINEATFTQSVDLIVAEVDNLKHMVTEFSAFAKLPESTPRLDYLAPVVEDCTTLFRNSHGRIDWRLHFKSEIPPIYFDREAMKRVLINIFTNAAEALVDRTDGVVALTLNHDKRRGRVRIEVGDNGPGVEFADKSRLFEPYFSKKREGTGLGLTIVKSIIADHGGIVRLNSIPGKGARVIIDLPDKTEG